MEGVWGFVLGVVSLAFFVVDVFLFCFVFCNFIFIIVLKHISLHKKINRVAERKQIWKFSPIERWLLTTQGMVINLSIF